MNTKNNNNFESLKNLGQSQKGQKTPKNKKDSQNRKKPLLFDMYQSLSEMDKKEILLTKEHKIFKVVFTNNKEEGYIVHLPRKIYIKKNLDIFEVSEICFDYLKESRKVLRSKEVSKEAKEFIKDIRDICYVWNSENLEKIQSAKWIKEAKKETEIEEIGQEAYEAKELEKSKELKGFEEVKEVAKEITKVEAKEVKEESKQVAKTETKELEKSKELKGFEEVKEVAKEITKVEAKEVKEESKQSANEVIKGLDELINEEPLTDEENKKVVEIIEEIRKLNYLWRDRKKKKLKKSNFLDDKNFMGVLGDTFKTWGRSALKS